MGFEALCKLSRLGSEENSHKSLQCQCLLHNAAQAHTLLLQPCNINTQRVKVTVVLWRFFHRTPCNAPKQASVACTTPK